MVLELESIAAGEFSDGANRVVGKRQQYFQRNPTVHTLVSFMQQMEQIGGLYQILHREFEKQRFSGFPLSRLLANRPVVATGIATSLIDHGGGNVSLDIGIPEYND